MEKEESKFILLLNEFEAIMAHAKKVYNDIEQLNKTQIQGDAAAPFSGFALFCHEIEDQLREKIV
jgi:hypothetical protein